MTHHEILSKERLFSEFYASTFYDCLSDMYTSVSEDDSFLEFSSDSNDVIIRLTQRQKTLEIDSDMESENETHGARGYAFAFAEERAKDISRKSDFTGLSGITTEYNHPQSVSELEELISGWSK